MRLMKKTLLIITILLLFSISYCVFGHVDDKIEMIEMKVEIKENGNANITEKWYVNSMERFSYFKFYKDLNESDIINFSVIDENDILYENLGKWDISMKNEDKVKKCGINSQEDGIELCWGVDDNGFHTYTLNYEISNFVKQFNECKGIKFYFIDERYKSNTISY